MKKGFTLVEVLITLGIIGVVTALAVPSLLARFQEIITITKVNQFYSQISSAYNSIINSNDQYSAMYELTSPEYSNMIIKDFCKHLKCEKLFLAGTGPNLSINNFINDEHGLIYSIDGTLEINTLAHENRALAVLSNGSIFAVRGQLATDTTANCLPSLNNNGANYCFLIDFIANRKVLQRGKSLFTFTAFQDIILPNGYPRFIYSNSFENNCLKKGYACTAWVIQFNNMDYLHCPEKLGWNKAHSCKD